MHTVRQVLNPDFSRTWQEAVAIVQEAASLLQPGLALPDPEDLILNESGVLAFGFGSESSEDPVIGLASLLDELLNGVEAPDSLRALAAENKRSEPANASVDAFSRALSFFERPNRSNDLKSIVGRLSGTPADKSSVELEFERLREKVAGPREEAEEKTPEAAKPRKRRVPQLTRVQQQVVAAGIIAGVLLGVFAIQGSPVPRLLGAYERAEAQLSGTISAGLDRLGVSQPAAASPAPAATASAATAPVEAQPVEKPSGVTTSSSPSTSRSASTPSHKQTVAHPTQSGPTARTAATNVPAANATPEPAAEIPAPGLASRSLSPPTVRVEPATVSPVVAPPAPPPPPLALAPAVPPPNGIYSPETPGVTPPVLTRPQMPREPAPGDDTGYFEIIVDEKGTAEQVKLISPRRRYHDRMLVAAAKAWQFTPATLDGRPVKYRVLVPIILSGLPY